MKRWWLFLLAGLSASGLPACGPSPRDLENVVTCYVESIQDGDGARWLGCASAELAREVAGGALPAGPGQAPAAVSDALRRYEARFLEQRKAGIVDFSSPDGILMTRLLSLGRGAFYATASTGLRDGRARLVQDVRLTYRLIDFPRHRRRGETLWRLGRPLGSIYPIIAGMTRMGAREELQRVRVEWDLERAPDGSWRVRSARLVPGSAEYAAPGE